MCGWERGRAGSPCNWRSVHAACGGADGQASGHRVSGWDGGACRRRDCAAWDAGGRKGREAGGKGMRGTLSGACRAIYYYHSGGGKECSAAVDGAMGRCAADIGSGPVAACADVPAVFAGENAACEARLAGPIGDLSSSFSGGDGGVLIAAAHAAADVPVLYGEPEPQRAGGDGAAGAGCFCGAAAGILCTGEPAFRGWAGADRVGGAEPGREEMDAGCAWNRRVRTQLSDGRNTGRSVGFGSGCMLGDRAAINTTNSGHKIICENSKKGVDKRLLL